MGRSGMAITLVTDRQTFIMRKFNRELGISIEERALYGGKEISSCYTSADRGHGPRVSRRYCPKEKPARKPASTSANGKAGSGKASGERQSERERDRKNKRSKMAEE